MPKIPEPTQPEPLAGYWSPEDADKLLQWDFVNQRMLQAKNYWIATVNPNGHPHVVPVWGVWLDDTLFFGGGSGARWSRNLAVRPLVTVHLDDSDQAVILQGTVSHITDPDSAAMKRIDDAYEPKYGMRHGPPIWELQLKKVIAWSTMPTATRWVFD